MFRKETPVLKRWGGFLNKLNKFLAFFTDKKTILTQRRKDLSQSFAKKRPAV
jgi:hypothetical protein